MTTEAAPRSPALANQSFSFAYTPMLFTTQGDELRAFLSNKNLDLEFPDWGKRSPLEATINAAYLPGSYFSYLRYGTPLAIKAYGDRPDFSLSMPHIGGFDLKIGRRSYNGGGRFATLGSPVHDQRTLLHEDSSRYGISFSQATVVRHLEALLGEPLEKPLEFEPLLDLHAASGQSFKATIDHVVHELHRAPNRAASSLFMTHLEQMAVDSLLLNQPHNFTARLNARADAPAPRPRVVRLAVEFLEANAGHNISLADLAAATGLPGRTLNEHFRKATGSSPLSYLRGVRMARARRALLHPEPRTTVTEVAHQWGFGHLGRFSLAYKCHYGESPSETLREALRRAGV